LATFGGTAVTDWTQYAYNYTANETVPMVTFGVDASSSMYILVDDTSVVDMTDSSVQLLNNPSFDNSSTTPPVGWDTWCSGSCISGYGGTVVTSGCRTGNCYKSQCRPGGTHDYLVQNFPATMGRTYNISFWFRRVNATNGGGTATLYVGII
jgi:hypothetical protein